MEGPANRLKPTGRPARVTSGIRTRVAEAVGSFAQVRGHLGQQLRLLEVEGLAELEQEGALSGRRGRSGEAKTRGGMAVEVGPGIGGEDDQTGLLSGGLEIGGEGDSRERSCRSRASGLIVAAGRGEGKPIVR